MYNKVLKSKYAGVVFRRRSLLWGWVGMDVIFVPMQVLSGNMQNLLLKDVPSRRLPSTNVQWELEVPVVSLSTKVRMEI